MGHWPPRQHPGPCPICGTAACACTSPEYGQITVVQLPERDRSQTSAVQGETAADVEPKLSTKTYRGDPTRRRR